MKLWIITVFLAAVGFIAILCWIILRGTTYADKIRMSRFKGRPLISDENFFYSYYGNSGWQKDVVVALRHELETAFRIPRETLLPTDKFSRELSVSKGWEHLDDSSDELFLLNRQREKSLGVSIPLEKLETVDEYIRMVAPLLNQEKR